MSVLRLMGKLFIFVCNYMSSLYNISDLAIIPSAVYIKYLFCFVLQNKSIHKSRDGVGLFCQPNTHICCEHAVLFLRNMFKFLGHSQFLEICATSKEVVLFYDNDFVLLRFACGFN